MKPECHIRRVIHKTKAGTSALAHFQIPMRHQGQITTWKDDKGFGFITPGGGGEQVFVHINSFNNRQRRPTGNEVVTYELTIDGKGRSQAKAVAYIGDRSAPVRGPGRSSFPPIFAVCFLAFVIAAVVTGRLSDVVLMIYGVASIVAFFAYALDKSAASRDRWRTPESTLHLIALVGGWPGALAAQRLLRHKSAKGSFQVMYWLTVALNCAALGLWLWPPGTQVLEALLGSL